MIISTPMTTEALAKALMVMVLDPKIRTYLEQNDPKALEQAEQALLMAGMPEPAAERKPAPVADLPSAQRWVMYAIENKTRRAAFDALFSYAEIRDEIARADAEFARDERRIREALDRLVEQGYLQVVAGRYDNPAEALRTAMWRMEVKA